MPTVYKVCVSYAILLILFFSCCLVFGCGDNTPNTPQAAYCGDETCNSQETCNTCPSDCGMCSYCGDGTCDNNETCSSCSTDCGRCKEDILKDIKNSIVWVKYEITGKTADGTYFETSGSGSGVIIHSDDSILQIYTNRHVIDCAFKDMGCYQRLSENVSVRTQDGNIYPVYRISIAPHDLDIAMLEVNLQSPGNFKTPNVNDQVMVGDNVTAVGYPSYADRVVEFSVAEGQISALKDLLMSDGFAFNSIESDAYTYFGSSGGGLFDQQGNLIGFNTWVNSGTTYQRSVAIKVSSLRNLTFGYCVNGYHSGKYCVNYCKRYEVLGKYDKCYGICDDFYCETEKIEVNDERCDSGYILGQDDYCHKPCGSADEYCTDTRAICYKSECLTCPVNTYLFKDGTCRVYE
jgi:hypothetical protein